MMFFLCEMDTHYQINVFRNVHPFMRKNLMYTQTQTQKNKTQKKTTHIFGCVVFVHNKTRNQELEVATSLEKYRLKL